MDTRFGMTVLVVVVLAVAAGIWQGQTHRQSLAAPAPTPVPTPLPTPAPGHVDILGGSGGPAFTPATIVVKVGHAVTWVNLDASDHSVTADNGAFNADVLNPGQSFTWKPKRAGRYTYSDFLDPNLSGVVVVQP